MGNTRVVQCSQSAEGSLCAFFVVPEWLAHWRIQHEDERFARHLIQHQHGGTKDLLALRRKARERQLLQLRAGAECHMTNHHAPQAEPHPQPTNQTRAPGVAIGHSNVDGSAIAEMSNEMRDVRIHFRERAHRELIARKPCDELRDAWSNRWRAKGPTHTPSKEQPAEER